MGAAQPTGPQAAPSGQQGTASSPDQGDASEQLPYGPRQGPTVRWEEVAGMAWIRPDPSNTNGGSLWPAAPGAPGTPWGPLRPTPGENSAFVLRLQDYGALQVQRFLDIDWARIAHSVTKEMFPREGKVGPAFQAVAHYSHRIWPGQGIPSPEVWNAARGPGGGGIRINAGGLHLHGDLRQGEHVWGRCPLQGHRQWPMVPPGPICRAPPGSHTYPRLPPGTGQGRNQTGNVYEAFVGLYWLEGQTQALVYLFLTLMDFDQIE